MKRIRILLVSPISDYKSYILPVWLRYVNSLKRSYNTKNITLDVILCDNSQNSTYHKQLSREFKCNILHTPSLFKNSRQFIYDSRNMMRDYFLSRDYDKFLSVECDVFPEPNFLIKLLGHKKRIVSLPYFIGEGEKSEPMIQMVDPDLLIPRETRNICSEELFLCSGKLITVFNAGLGCTLISRDVIEKIPFRWDADIHFHDDSFFAEDCFNSGIKWHCDTSTICRHLNKAWNYFPDNKF